MRDNGEKKKNGRPPSITDDEWGCIMAVIDTLVTVGGQWRDIEVELIRQSRLPDKIGMNNNEIPKVKKVPTRKAVDRFLKKNFDSTFAEYSRDKQAAFVNNLKQVMYKRALSGNDKMLRWVSTNVIGWSNAPKEIQQPTSEIFKVRFGEKGQMVRSAETIEDNLENLDPRDYLDVGKYDDDESSENPSVT